MKRRIVKQAEQAYTLTLPIKWVRENGLEKGSELDLKVNEKEIIISTENKLNIKKVNLKFGDISDRTIRNYILSLYAGGVDEILIDSEKEINSEINSALNNLMGFALISQENKKYIIKDLNAGSYQHLDEILKRVFQMIILFYESAIQDIFGLEKESIESLKNRDTEVNKFCLYLQRAINKSSYDDVVNSRIIFTVSFLLEKISDEIERLWRANIKYRPKKIKDMKKLAEFSKETFAKSYDLYYSFTPKIIEEVYKMREKVREDSLKLFSKDQNSNRMIRHIVKVAEDAADLIPLIIMINNK